jgi:hypothetical protein
VSIDDILSRLAQDPRNQISQVVWGDGAKGMLFLYARASSVTLKGSVPPACSTVIRGLPDEFDISDLFADDNEQVDEPDFLTAPGDTAEPITDAALAKFLSWTPHKPLSSQKVDTTDATIFYSWVDPASEFGPLTLENYQDEPKPGRQSHDSWGVSLSGQMLFRWEAAGGGFFKNFPEAYQWGQDHGWDVSTTTYSMGSTNKQDIINGMNLALAFYADVYHYTGGSGGAINEIKLTKDEGSYFTRFQSGVAILNVAKLRKYQLADRVTGKKPDTLSFTIDIGGYQGTAQFEAWMLPAMDKQAKPPVPGRRTFPLNDLLLEPEWDEVSAMSQLQLTL